MPFRAILDADAERGRGAIGHVVPAEADAHRQPFREIVKRDRYDEQPDPRETRRRRRRIAADEEMFVRDVMLDGLERQPDDQDGPGSDEGRGPGPWAAGTPPPTDRPDRRKK